MRIFITAIMLLIVVVSYVFLLKPQPVLVLVGGGNLPVTAKKEFLKYAGGENANIVVICSASSYKDIVAESLACWSKENVRSLHVINPRTQQEAENYYNTVGSATGVWIGGGDQVDLYNIFKNTKVLQEIMSLYKRGVVVGGTSAGASIASEIMISEGKAENGFGFLDVIIDQHFSERQRHGRLKKLVIEYNKTGIGIDEDTAVVVTDKVKVLGSGSVSLCTPDKTLKYQDGDTFFLP